MAAKHHQHVALTDILTSFVDNHVAEGRSACASEVMRAALCLLIEQGDLGTYMREQDSREHG